MHVILASASPRRQELLKQIFEEFIICPAQMEEVVPNSLPVADCPAYLATEKAKRVAAMYPDALVIGSDTAVILGDAMLGKPTDASDAVAMLSALSGQTHQVITGCCLIYGGRVHAFREVTDVRFKNLTAGEIAEYVATGECFDKAGAYAIQGLGGALVAAIDGDFDNVVGLPVKRLWEELRHFGGIS